MRHFQLMFVDLDGTLLNQKNQRKYVSSKNAQAIKDYLNLGNKVVISTGRLGEFVLKFMTQLKIDYAVCGNGSQIINWKGEILKQWNITKVDLKKINQIILKEKLAVKINQKRVAFNVTSPKAKAIAKQLNYQLSRNRILDLWEEHVYKLIIWGYEFDKLKIIKKQLQTLCPTINVTFAERGLTLEVTHQQANKALGNAYVLKHFYPQISLDNCCHIGDTLNDAPVMQIFKYFIAPENSERALLAKAPYLTVSHHHDCVFAVIKGNFWVNHLNSKITS